MNHAIDSYRLRRRFGVAALFLVLVVVGAASLGFGAVDVAPGEVMSVLVQQLGLDPTTPPSAQAVGVVWGLRVPRLLMGVIVGAALAVSGAGLQGLLRNDLADPHLLGIGPGAAIGAAVGSGLGGVQAAIAGGVFTGVLTAFIVRRIARGRTADPNRLILAGVALGATLSAWVGFVVFGSDRAVVPPIEFWLLGSLSGATWRGLGTVAVFLVVGVLALLGVARTLDILVLGHREAAHLGVDVGLFTTICLIVTGVVVGATVGVAGVIVFVGLLIPQLMRPVTGPFHRHLMLGSLVAGAVFVASADLVARLAIEPIELPVGLVTSVLGGPMFLWIVSRRRRVV
ncbi:MAG TPA: iron ABC transporter permease [Acidimicrobiia bacterium]